MPVIVENAQAAAEALQSAVGAGSTVVSGLEQVRRHLEVHPDEYAVILGSSVDLSAGVALADALRVSKPALGVILVRRRVDAAVLAEALRAGMREVVEDRDLRGVNDAVVRAYALYTALTTTDGIGDSTTRGQLITVFSAKGGVGKTTVATNLAAALADKGRRSVCIVDLDLAFGDVSIVLQLFPVHTIADAVGIDRNMDPLALESLLTDHSPGLKALAAPVQPESKERISAALIRKVLHILKERFDVVVVDTPPAFDEVVLQAFDESDLVLLVGTLDMPSLKSLKVTGETLSLLNHPRDRWRLILNRADMKVGLTPAEFEKTLNMAVTAAIPQSNDVPASVNHGKPIVLESPKHPVSQVFRALAAECAAHAPARALASHGATDELESHRRGLLRRRAAK
jgi:pilus assembly protein CpaE